MNATPIEDLLQREADWCRAMVANDADAIGRFMADDWTIVGPDDSVIDRSTFLELVRSGTVSHDVMELNDNKVRVYGDAAVVTARGLSSGKYRGQEFHVRELVSDFFVRVNGEWRCVHTHLTKLPS